MSAKTLSTLKNQTPASASTIITAYISTAGELRSRRARRPATARPWAAPRAAAPWRARLPAAAPDPLPAAGLAWGEEAAATGCAAGSRAGCTAASSVYWPISTPATTTTAIVSQSIIRVETIGMPESPSTLCASTTATQARISTCMRHSSVRRASRQASAKKLISTNR